MSKVSVIIPVYNMEKYLEQCLDSVISQTLQDIEILCINDGSKDKSCEILKCYREKDSRIHIIDQENKGVVKSRNTGIREADGEYVIFMDPDDWYPSDDILEKLYQAAVTNRVEIAGGTFMDYHDGIYNEEFEERYFGYHFEREGVIAYKDYQFDFGYQRFLFSKKLLTEHRIFFKDYIRYQDPPFLVEAMIAAERFYGMNQPSYCYRYGHEEISWNRDKVCAVLQGIRDNLDISRKHGLAKLHQLCVVRLNEEYRQLIGDSIFFEDYAIDVEEEMMKTFLHIDASMLEDMELYKVLTPIVERMKENIVDHITRLSEYMRRYAELEYNSQEEIRTLQSENYMLQLDLDNVYQSFSYRFGHKVTAPVRAVGRLVRGKKEDDNEETVDGNCTDL